MSKVKKQIVIGFVCLMLCSSIGYFVYAKVTKTTTAIPPVDFLVAMESRVYASRIADPHAAAVLQHFKRIYDKNHPGRVIRATDLKIPPYIHMIWLGSPLPVAYEPFRQSWLVYHPDWTVIFWTDNSANYQFGTEVFHSFDELEHYLATHTKQKGMHLVVDTSQLSYSNKRYFDASGNYGERSDILRWEIVYRFGGLYVDTDFECLRAHDELHYCYDFYTGIQPLDTSCVQLGAALFGAVPHHPILRECVEGIAYNQHLVPIIVKTGPLHFTRCFFTKVNEGPYVNIAFPASFFYPRSYEQRFLPKELWAKKEAFAVHHWQASWTKPEAIVKM